jgi:hypothetical protein
MGGATWKRSDSGERRREVALFFRPDELVSWQRDVDPDFE